MKHLIVYSILICIGFLNVPRTLVHDCDDHITHVASHDNHSDEHHFDDLEDDQGVSIEEDDCFMCEFQLDFFEVPQFVVPKGVKANYYVAAPGQTDKAHAQFTRKLALRGPPAIV